MKVIVAEDDRATRTRIVSYLKQWGYDPLTASNGAEALDLYRSNDCALIVTDWLMPEMDGLELIRHVQEGPSDKLSYIILVTARSGMKDVVEGIEAGADDFITKPFHKEDLRVRIEAGKRVIALEMELHQQNRRLESVNRELTTTNERMKNSLLSAAQIQRSYLPDQLPKTDLARFAWQFEPCDELAGDTLNIFPLDRDNFGIYMIDVSGHGVPAALLSVHLSRILSRRSGPESLVIDSNARVRKPSDVAAQLNERFSDDTSSQQFFTLLYGILDLSEREFRYTSAGHPGPIVVSNGVARIYEPSPPGIGLLPKADYTEKTLQLEKGDRLVLYTDGAYEVFNGSEEEFGEKRLASAANSPKPLQSMVNGLLQSARDWANGKPFEDDVSLLGVEIC